MAVCVERYKRKDDGGRKQLSGIDAEREEECGICMEMNSKIVLPNCGHAMCMGCYRDWYKCCPLLTIFINTILLMYQSCITSYIRSCYFIWVIVLQLLYSLATTWRKVQVGWAVCELGLVQYAVGWGVGRQMVYVYVHGSQQHLEVYPEYATHVCVLLLKLICSLDTGANFLSTHFQVQEIIK